MDVVPGFESLTVCFDPRQCSGTELAGLLERQAAGCDPVSDEDRLEYRISVRFSREDSPDLEEVAGLAGLSVQSCIE
ncbi:MAG: carboxyltransferase domain-containing protein, partial [Planctomycetaceae bacterium]